MDIDEEERITTAIGRCIIAWAEIEQSLYDLFATISGATPLASHRIMQSVVAFEAKLKTIHALFLDYASSDPPQMPYYVLLDGWSGLYRHIQKQKKQRNMIAHAGLVRGEPTYLAPFNPPFGLYESGRSKLGSDDLSRIASEFYVTFGAIWWLNAEIASRLREPREPNLALVNDLVRQLFPNS